MRDLIDGTTGQNSIAPLVTFRVLFGLLMCAAAIRFWMNGWIEEQLLEPTFHFSFFENITVLPSSGMYAVFSGLVITALCIAFGAFFRFAAVVYAVLFTYVELLDKTWYLNHYYLISLLAVLLAISPAHKAWSVDVALQRVQPVSQIPKIYLRAIQVQLALVYFFAGIAKINSDWLLEAQPLHIWLHTRSDLPLIGSFLAEPLTAYVASWVSMIFDVCVGFLLFYRRTAVAAWIIAALFHVLTAILFPEIGVFPYVMILLTTVFLPIAWHERLWRKIKPAERVSNAFISPNKILHFALTIWFVFQFLFPLRCWLYNGRLFYNEEGYRFSWRVMLMEKAGQAFFTIVDPDRGRKWPMDPLQHLTKAQEKQMSTQPDMILQFAHYLKRSVQDSIPNAQVYCDAYITVNGRATRAFIDPKVDLAQEVESWRENEWVRDE